MVQRTAFVPHSTIATSLDNQNSVVTSHFESVGALVCERILGEEASKFDLI
jgi:hypothetical protein